MNRHELADAMLRGKATQGVQESRSYYIASQPLFTTCQACALGCAIIGKYGGDYKQAESETDDLFDASPDTLEAELAARILDIPCALAIEIEHKHLNGMPVEQIAVWLKTSEQEAMNV